MYCHIYGHIYYVCISVYIYIYIRCIRLKRLYVCVCVCVCLRIYEYEFISRIERELLRMTRVRRDLIARHETLTISVDLIAQWR